MVVEQDDSNVKGEFYIELDGVREARMTYSWAGKDKIIIDHTEVSENLRGKGAGFKLVEESVNFARKNNLKIMPLCPFAKAVFDKTGKYHDVVF